jgi:uncharacterized protein (DUF2147 family)
MMDVTASDQGSNVRGMKSFTTAELGSGVAVRARGAWAVSAATLAIAVLSSPASAADPTGDWLTENGAAVIRIEQCSDAAADPAAGEDGTAPTTERQADGALCGAIAWVKTPGTDRNNPDPAKRNVDIVGLPILLGMRPVSENRWEGQVYNAENGKNYLAYISLVEPDVLKIKGCVLGGLFCGGEKWTRQTEPMPPMPPAASVQ